MVPKAVRMRLEESFTGANEITLKAAAAKKIENYG